MPLSDRSETSDAGTGERRRVEERTVAKDCLMEDLVSLSEGIDITIRGHTMRDNPGRSAQ